MSVRIYALSWSAIFFYPSFAYACATCMPTDGPTINAYRFSTLGLSLFPLLVIGGGLYWITRLIARHAAETSEDDMSPSLPNASSTPSS